MINYFSVTPPENSGGAEKSIENSGPHGKNFFCSMYDMSQRHPVWVAENQVNPCNSVLYIVPVGVYLPFVPYIASLSDVFHIFNNMKKLLIGKL